MAASCSQEAVLDFLRENGGGVKTTDLPDRFQPLFPEEPEGRAAVRSRFKDSVDNVAPVRAEGGLKFVCLKKKFRASMRDPSVSGGVPGAEALPARGLTEEGLRYPDPPDRIPAEAAPAARPAARAGARRAPGSGTGSDSQVSAARVLSEPDAAGVCDECVGAPGDSGLMGNRGSLKRDRPDPTRGRVRKTPDIPQITVIAASPLPAEASVFTLPGPVEAQPDGAGPPPSVEAQLLSVEAEKTPETRKGPEEDVGEDEGDANSLSGSDGSASPSRRHFIEVMMSSSPQLRRNLALRHSSRSDSDSVSLASSIMVDEDRVALDPLEHEWMMCASDGEWPSLNRLLGAEPGLLLRKDFVTGFTCLHWAAKLGKPELLALIVNFAKQNDVPIDVDVRSNTGYTPLHVAAMHNHMEVVKLLVGAYNADVDARDYSGRKACQYLTDDVGVDLRDIIGAYEHSESDDKNPRVNGRWRFPKVLQPNLRPPRLLHPKDSDCVEREVRMREKPTRRKTSFSRMKPRLDRFRIRTSQIIHSASFWDTEQQEQTARDSFRSRPKTHFLG
ncbi:ankyrin repeat domain-containing protein SOWAHC-like [Antennarius striatus]|uniref:ankyrin repeat domain-containing protein SOWAHC-like n=1 Tax=Antennarius striatus TaxID=241820 RepID=UPI0035AE75E7